MADLSRLKALQAQAAKWQQAKRKYGHLLNQEFFVFDLETTNLLRDTLSERVTKQVGIVEAALAKWDPKRQEFVDPFTNKVGVWSQRFKPHIPITAGATNIHGITNEAVAELAGFDKDIGLKIAQVVKGKPVVGQHLAFDLEVLDQNLLRNKLKPAQFSEVVDVWHIGRSYYPVAERTALYQKMKKPSSLEQLAALFGITHEKAHQAAADVLVTGKTAVQMFTGEAPTGMMGKYRHKSGWLGMEAAEAGKHQLVMPMRPAGPVTAESISLHRKTVQAYMQAQSPSLNVLQGMKDELMQRGVQNPYAHIEHEALWQKYFAHSDYVRRPRSPMSELEFNAQAQQRLLAQENAADPSQRWYKPTPTGDAPATVSRRRARVPKKGLRPKVLTRIKNAATSPIGMGMMIGAAAYGVGYMLGMWDAAPNLPAGHAGLNESIHMRHGHSMSKVVDQRLKYAHLMPTRPAMTPQPHYNMGQRRESAGGIVA